MDLFRRRDSVDQLRRKLRAALDDGDLEAVTVQAARLEAAIPAAGAEDLHLLAAAYLEVRGFSHCLELCRQGDAEDLDLLRLRVEALAGLAAWEDACADAESLARRGNEPEAWHRLGQLARRARRHELATTAFAEAQRLDPEVLVPLRLERSEFEALVAEAVDSIPAEFLGHLANTLIELRYEPSDDEVRDGLDLDLLGLYVGGTVAADDGPERIIVFQAGHEDSCGTLDQLREQVRETILHEVGHHFGMEEDELPF